jgi:hypothetical protein
MANERSFLGRAGLGVLVAGLLAALPAGAQHIYRCTGPDGETFFTSDAAACDRAERHEPTHDVQHVDSPKTPQAGVSAPGAAAPAAAPAEPPSEDAQAAMWKRKRTDAEAELMELEHKIQDFDEIVSWCNRGGGLVVEDKVGVRKDYDCDDARSSYDNLSSRRTELKKYLNGGLEDECRRAGCLPGWLR